MVVTMGGGPAGAQTLAAASTAWQLVSRPVADPMDARATLQMLTELDNGGVQRVVAKSADDAARMRLVRLHLHDIRDRIPRGDFPWQAKASGTVLVGYRDVPTGGGLTFQAQDAGVVAALHEWFNARAADERANVAIAHRLRR
jgi:hypothetical protein